MITPGEKRQVEKILGYEQPECPGCGHKMTLGVEEATYRYPWEHGKVRFRAWYFCRSCRVWRTDSCGAYSANIAVENAYKMAMTRYKK